MIPENRQAVKTGSPRGPYTSASGRAIGLRLTAYGSIQLRQHLLHALIPAVECLLFSLRKVAQRLGQVKLIPHFLT